MVSPVPANKPRSRTWKALELSGMALKVFLSYGTDPNAQVAAWRLQTLATSYGIHVSVPQRNGYALLGRSKLPPEEVRRAIDKSNCVVAIITGQSGPVVEGELNYALQKRKLVIPIVQEGIGPAPFLKGFPRVFRFSSWENQGRVENEVVDFLKQQKQIDKQNQEAIGVLVAVGLGLFLWALAEK